MRKMPITKSSGVSDRWDDPVSEPVYGGEPQRHYGFITKRYEVEEREPLQTAEAGKTIGQLVDEYIEAHTKMVHDERMACLREGNPYRGPSALRSVTIQLPEED